MLYVKNLEKQYHLIELRIFHYRDMFHQKLWEEHVEASVAYKSREEFRDKIILKTFYILQTYLRPATVEAFHVRTRLPKIVSVVENLFFATARLMLHIVQWTDLTFGLDIYFLRRDLKEGIRQAILFVRW